MDDNELIASFEPSGGRYLLVLAFDDVEDMVKTRERTLANLCGWTDQGDRIDKVEVVAMTRGAYGQRSGVDGSVALKLLVSSAQDDEDMEQLRKSIAIEEIKRRAPIGALVAERWKPSPEHMDMLEKWAEEAIAVFEPVNDWRPRAKPARIRKGYNSFCEDHGAPELTLHGIHGGRALVDFLKLRFGDDLQYLYDPNNPYIQGLYRKPNAKQSWFPTILGTEK